MTINESIYMALSVSDASKVNLLLMGNPGSGKTTSVEFFAKANNMKMVLLRGSQSSPEEILGYEVNDGEMYCYDNVNVRVASKVCPKWYNSLMENSKNGIRTLLFLDEITTASSFVQATLLQVIFGREIDNGYRLPDDTFVVAAGNYAGNLSSDFNLIPPLMNRFCIYNVEITSEDIKSFMSRYSDRQDIVSKLKSFNDEYSSDDTQLSSEFKKVVKRSMESKLCECVQSLISQNKFDPNITEMSDIYSDKSTGHKLLGFLTPRTMCYFLDVSIHMYLKYGIEGISSKTFFEMTSGLVGISLSSNGNSVKKELLTDEFIKLMTNVSQQLDKARVSSISSAESQINRIISKINTFGDKEEVKVLPSSSLISLQKVFESLIEDRGLKKIQTPIESKVIFSCLNSVISTARNVLFEDSIKIKEMSKDLNSGKSVDTGLIDIESVNGGIKNYNDSIRLYKVITKFVNKSEFGYDSELLNLVNKTDRDALKKNRLRIDIIKRDLSRVLGVSMSELVETENID